MNYGETLKVLVTGATGFIGSHVADLLLQNGYSVRCIYRKSSNLRWLKDRPFELVEASFADVESLKEAARDVDYIIHSAGVVAARDEKGFMQGNRDATLNLLEAAKLTAPNLKRFVQVSSQTVAGPSHAFNNPRTEDMPAEPITAYGRSKLAAELAVLSFKDIFPVTIVRPPAVFGPRDTAIYQMFQVAQKGFGTLIGFSPKFLNLIHSSDLARGIVQAMESDKSVGETYFIASEHLYSWPQIMDAIKTALNQKRFMIIKIPHILVHIIAAFSEFFGKFSKYPPVFNRDKGKDFVQNYWTCSVDKAKKDLGFKQEISLEDGIKQTINWYKEHGWLK